MPWRRILLWGILGLGMLGILAALVGTVSSRRLAARRQPPTLGQVPAFELIDQDGGAVTLGTLRGETWVASFIFTRCGGFCPRITQRMAALGARLPAAVRRVSISVDPAHDTPEVLATYAQRYSARGPGWRFLTGEPTAVATLVASGFKLAVGEGVDPAEPIIHSARLVLVDGSGAIRGYYDSEDPAALDSLVRDARVLAD